MARLELRQLLSSCLALNRAACDAIREVQGAREAQVSLRRVQNLSSSFLMQGNEALGTILKDISDPRTALTLADTRAQDIIWKGLRWEEKGGGMEWNQ